MTHQWGTPRPLALPELGTLARIGVQLLDAGAGEDAAYKSAESDALKRAAMAFGVGLAQLYLETGEAMRWRQRNRSAKQEMNGQSAITDRHQIEWQARIEAALAMPDTNGKAVWQQLVKEAIESKSAARLNMLVKHARSIESAQAIRRLAARSGVDIELRK